MHLLVNLNHKNANKIDIPTHMSVLCQLMNNNIYNYRILKLLKNLPK